MPRPRKTVRKGRKIALPLLAARDTVLFPRMIVPLLVRRERSLKAVEEGSRQDRSIVVVAQRDQDIVEPTLENLHQVGTEAIIGRIMKMPDGTMSVWVQGQRRVLLEDIFEDDSSLRVDAIPIVEFAEKSPQVEALMRAVLALFEKCVRLSHTLPEDAYLAAVNSDGPGWLADLIISSMELDLAQKQEMLEALDPLLRLQRVSTILAREVDLLELENKIHSQVQQEVDKTQRTYFLREQIKAIQKELGDVDVQTKETNELSEKIVSSGMSATVAKKANVEVDRLLQIPSASPEVSVVRTYLDWLVSLPWEKKTEDNLDLRQASKILDENHYGLPKVKERIIEYIAVRKLAAEKLRTPILCFVGAPGVGKTSLGMSIAQALGRHFLRVSLGGIRDEAEIRGHRRTYVGAMPGRIIQTMRNAGTINPVFMLDEIDKVGTDFRGDPSSALLEVLDPEQNQSTQLDNLTNKASGQGR